MTDNIIATNDGNIYQFAATYAGQRDAASGSVNTSYLDIGQTKYYGVYFLGWRFFASFAIPDMATLTSASLFLYGNGDGSTIDFNIYLHTSTYTDPITGTDYVKFDGHQTGIPDTGTVLNDAWNSSQYLDTWNEIVFNAAGRAAILAKKNNTFKMAAISKEDYDNSPQTGDEYIFFESSETLGKEPYLSLTYTTVSGTNMQINIGNVLKDVATIQVNISDEWKPVTKAQINISDAWKTVFG